ncbi:MAG: glycosyltransferase family 2 protein [Patescibacteria group bacterium]|nr:glycosyltransferase family 2 protein [Patescibacteria group bacterium]MCL5432425.1 glycosyltransferase family 2 protein [Patescibacteria group bacterium]
MIRTKNEERHIGEVLAALKKQTRQDFEIIIVDSGSTDKTLEIIRKFSVRLIQIEPGDFNYSYALNLGINKSKGQYIGILSGHSVPQGENFYADGLKFFADKKVAAVTGYYADSHSHFANSKLFLKAMRLRSEQHRCPWLTNTNSLIRRDLWRIYPFDERLIEGSEDYDWACEMLARGYDIVKTPLFSAIYYRVNGKSSYWKMRPVWDRINAEIGRKTRPGKSYTKL